jgi:ADP-ribosylglycohydrolase
MGSGSDEIEEIRQQIDESRENLGAAVGALAYKADVKNRGKEAIDDKKEAIMEKVQELKSKVTGGGEGSIGETVKAKLPSGDDVKAKLPDRADISEKVDAMKSKLPDSVTDAAPSAEDVKRKAQQVAGAAHDHPIAVTAGAAAAGLVAGLALPETELERQKLAPTARHVREQVQGRAQEVVEHAKQAAKDVVAGAADAVASKGQEHGGKLGEIASNAAEKTREQITLES